MKVRASLLILIISLAGCSATHKPWTIFRAWHGAMVTLSDPHLNESITEPIEKFGYLNLTLSRDSTFEFSLGVLKDVVLARNVFGVEGNVVLLKAVYKSERFGKLRLQDSSLILSSPEGVIFVSQDSVHSELHLRYTDREHRKWLCTLAAKE
ncbi:MAG: hypothetical protein Q8922_03170 [Bacteroidota bacterium]|nr:hypothetical protein [Bacteroidota bacterium]MDP4232967.1 hypothetical protein [Bacteroidota bacterium]MDP4242011.1 hypothetical protein [Bacteroidota bacterium]MDP4286914.1 hypothetical protein [Bacteroidota bacterium]